MNFSDILTTQCLVLRFSIDRLRRGCREVVGGRLSKRDFGTPSPGPPQLATPLRGRAPNRPCSL